MTKLGKAISKFNCSGCGCCCARVNIAVSNIENLAKTYNLNIKDLSFPYKWDETGKCEMLDIDNRCKVYYNRPNFCNIEWFIENTRVNREEFYNFNAKVCNSLMDEDGIDKSFRI